MSDAPTFSFAAPASSGGANTSGLFSSAPSSNNASNTIFGSSSANNTQQSGGGLFGSSSSLTTSIPGAFGGTPLTSPPSQTSLFGTSASTQQKPTLFGNPGRSGGVKAPGQDGGSSQIFSGFSTSNKVLDKSNSGQNKGTVSISGGRNTGGAGLLGSVGAAPTTSGQSILSTPATPRAASTSSFGNISTTPAGPAPSHNPGVNDSVDSQSNGNKSQESNSVLFGNLDSNAQSQAQSPSVTFPSNPFGGASQAPSLGLFGSTKPSDLAPVSSAQPAGSLFGNAGAATGGSNLFGNKKPAKDSQQAQSEGFGRPESLFGKVTPPKPTSESSHQGVALPTFEDQNKRKESTAEASQQPFSFAPAAASQHTPQAEQNAGLTKPSTSSLFGAMQGQGTRSTTSAASTAAPTSSLFSNLGASKVDHTPRPTQPTQPASSSLFGSTEQAKASQLTGQPLGLADNVTKPTNNLGASSQGPKPPAQSRLKNKSMDEIITRWASDLSKYQKEFQKQACQVATWDRMLVENSDKIQKLYGRTLEAERATVEVERQLSAVEGDQVELEYWLEFYERQVDELTASQIGQGDALQGPDQERERTYKLAEKLSDRLDEMGKDLTSMIEEINDTSSNLNKTHQTDDPLSQIVRVLNNHLSQLQQIDQGAAGLQSKVTAAQKASKGMGGLVTGGTALGSRNDAAADFFDTYMGRR